MKINKLLACLGISVVCFTAASPVYAAVAGHVQFVNGDVQVTNAAGQSRPAQKGDAVNEGDTLTSAQKSSAQVKMQDGGFVAVREDTKLKFDQFVFAGKEDGSEKSFFSLFKGGFRAVTGLIGRINKQNYKVTTPAATIGIRGTDHETFVITPGSPLAQVAPAGAYNKVNVGETSMTTDKGTIFVQPNQMGFAGGMNQMPQVQPVNTNVFTVAEAPAPGAKAEKKEEKEEKAGAKQEEKAAKSGKEEGKKEEAKTEAAAEGSAAGEEAPVREAAVVDAATPATAAAPPAATSTIAATTTAEIIAPPAGPQVQTTTTLTAGGTTLNLAAGTGTTAGGQVITPGVTPAPAPVATAAYVQSDLAGAFVTSSSSSASIFVQLDTLIAKPADMNNALPNPSYIDRYVGKDVNSNATYTLNGTTTVGQAATTLANGIQFGRWDSTSAQSVVVGNTNCCVAGTYPSNTSVYSHWVAGPAVNPVYLPEVLLGTATYTFAGGTTPTVTTVATGFTAPTLNTASTSLSVNFTQQLVTFNLALSGIPWTASATAPLQMMYWNGAKTGFRATTDFAVRTGWAPLTVTGATTGDVVGQLTGNGLDGAVLSYVLNGQVATVPAQVSGVAAFTGTAQNTATPYRIAALSTIDTIPVGQANAGLTVPVERGGYNNSASVQFDVAGNAIQFNADKPFSNGSANTINIGTATAVGLGTDPVSGISWGRWQGGNLAITDLATNTTFNPANVNSHWIAGPTMTGPVDLPVSGTFNYVLAGGTATDSLGGVGTLNNTSSLTANFTTQTVAITLDVTTPNAGNLVASGTNIPIEQKSFFNAGTANAPNGGANLGSLTITCPAGCAGAVLSGHLGGVFVGTGGIGAGVAYGMQKDAVIVNGVAAFHR